MRILPVNRPAKCAVPCLPCQVARLLALVPPWVRVYRIQRDIPMPLVTSGVEVGNLRELALARMGVLGLRCRDVRTREAGIQVRRPPLKRVMPIRSPFSPPAVVLLEFWVAMGISFVGRGQHYAAYIRARPCLKYWFIAALRMASLRLYT